MSDGSDPYLYPGTDVLRNVPGLNAARAWARLAKHAGQKYMVMTTKHHEGFCLFNTQYTDYCAPQAVLLPGCGQTRS
jgi:hypothetical protein